MPRPQPMPPSARAVAMALILAAGPVAVAAQSTDYDGAAATGLALRRLGASARVLHIGAHPDDENTALFAPLVLGRGIDAAYLSLTRGEGGQNGIGPELGAALGLVRSEELLAARRLDGGDQLFTRAVDYGYSRDAAEAFRHWPRDSLLADVVEAIRSYRPDVVISVWSGTPRDGHGQHHASGILAREAVLAAADAARFPEQIDAGLRPHAAGAFYWSGRFSGTGPDVALATGVLDPLLGRSYHQIAMASRSRHRSQDMGVPQAPGPRRTAFDRIDPADPPPVGDRSGFGGVPEGVEVGDGSLFAGLDTLLSQRADRLAAAAAPVDRPGLRRIAALLLDYERQVAAIRAAFNPLDPGAVLPPLAAAATALETAAGALEERALPALPGLPALSAGSADGAIRDLHFHLADEIADVGEALLRAANVKLDVVAGDELVVAGQTFDLELAVWNGGTDPVEAEAGPFLPAGWIATRVGDDGAAPTLVVEPGERAAAAWRVTVPADAELTTPYFLRPGSPPAPVPDFYAWPDDPDVRGRPFAPDPVRGSFILRIADTFVSDERAAAWVGVDRRSGEFRRPVRVVPAVSVALGPDVAILPAGADRRTLRLTARVRSDAPAPLAGELRLQLPAGWTARPDRVPLTLEPGAGERTIAFEVTAPSAVAAGAHVIEASVRVGDRTHVLGYDIIDYPHIAPRHLYGRARTTVGVFDVRVADIRVGYVVGAGDGGPEALDQLGVRWEPLDAADLAAGDLARFDVIVTGIRAYEVRPDLVAHNQRLLDFARAGGTVIVQYNKYEFPAGGFAPWPVTMGRPHGRVTDPAAPVTHLAPRHPALTAPNPIGPADWDGWVQERGLYFLESWDGPFTPLLAMGDPGEEPLDGALLVAPLGQGLYVYTGLAFFRQLPAGVPGAYRLFANLISLGAAGAEAAR
ncbi:MAG TPA: PIG-L family deacetylase [Longimicrobiales bacterium]|nr:PIG-L family deacetylase [Longimicrobiales bacterium]